MPNAALWALVAVLSGCHSSDGYSDSAVSTRDNVQSHMNPALLNDLPMSKTMPEFVGQVRMVELDHWQSIASDSPRYSAWRDEAESYWVMQGGGFMGALRWYGPLSGNQFFLLFEP